MAGNYDLIGDNRNGSIHFTFFPILTPDLAWASVAFRQWL